jgi:hypothetical protein
MRGAERARARGRTVFRDSRAAPPTRRCGGVTNSRRRLTCPGLQPKTNLVNWGIVCLRVEDLLLQ